MDTVPGIDEQQDHQGGQGDGDQKEDQPRAEPVTGEFQLRRPVPDHQTCGVATPAAGAGVEDAQEPDRTEQKQQDQTRQHPSDGCKQPGYRQEEEGHGEPCLTVPETPPPTGGWQCVGHVRDPTGEGCLRLAGPGACMSRSCIHGPRLRYPLPPGHKPNARICRWVGARVVPWPGGTCW